MARQKTTKVPTDAREAAAEWVAIDAVTPWDDNPRRNDIAAQKVAESIKRFGFSSPIIARREDGEIIAGHTRLKAAKILGLDKVPVRYLDLDPADAHLLALADNKLGEVAEWDPIKLADVLSDYGLEQAELAGWDSVDLEKLADEVADFGPLESETPEEEGELPEPPKDPVTKKGDLWILGDHRLVCGDSTSPTSIRMASDAERPRLVHTDPPYGVDYTGGSKKRERLAGDHIGTGIYSAFLSACVETVDPRAPLYLWHADRASMPVLAALDAHGYDVRAQIVWNKNQAQFGSMGAQYKPKHEPCFYAFRRGVAPYWYGPNNEVTVWDVPRARSNDYHPTQKPVELAERAIKNSSMGGDRVLDGFGGSGSTLVACESLSRRCAMVELDPAYCDVIVERWENLTGGKAHRG